MSNISVHNDLDKVKVEENEGPKVELKGRKRKCNDSQSNPSKRHRQRLNLELENISKMLPFEDNVVHKLDKLSILRLSVGYLRAKTFFSNLKLQPPKKNTFYKDVIYDATDGFILVFDKTGQILYSDGSIERVLGYHQTDIVHQNAYSLIHPEDQYIVHSIFEKWSSISHPESNIKRKETHISVRMRSLSSSTNGFVLMELTGFIRPFNETRNECINYAQVGYSHIQSTNDSCEYNVASEILHTALFLICKPIPKLPFFDIEYRIYYKDSLSNIDYFETTHEMNLDLIEPHVKNAETTINQKKRNLYHFSDLRDVEYVASVHRKVLKLGKGVIVAYRWINSNKRIDWVQTYMKISETCTNSQSTKVINCYHQKLSESEGVEYYRLRNINIDIPPIRTDYQSLYLPHQMLENTIPNTDENFFAINHTILESTTNSTPNAFSDQKSNIHIYKDNYNPPCLYTQTHHPNEQNYYSNLQQW